MNISSTTVIWVSFSAILTILLYILFYLLNKKRRLTYIIGLQKEVPNHNIETELILRAMKLSTWTIDCATRRVVYENDYRSRVNAFKPTEDATYDSTYEMIHPEDSPRVKAALDAICDGSATEYHQQYRARGYGSSIYYWAESYATVAVRDNDGKPKTLIGASMIIEDRKRIEEALVEAEQKAKESENMKSAFLNNISHEIRTPLNAIVGFSEILTNIDDAEERKKLNEIIHRNNSELLRIFSDIVNVSSLESGNSVITTQDIDLNLLIREIVDDEQKMITGDTLTITGFYPEKELILTTDKSRLENIIYGFLSNAIKFSFKGNIIIGYTRQDGKVRVWVKDSGKGIAKDDQQRIFDKFVKLDEFTQGTGLGLYICRQFALSLGGSVGVKSREGIGSTFWVELPVNQADKPSPTY